MTYTLTAHPNTIVRDEDGAFIPTDPDNVDYQEYLKWLEEGNEPTPYTPPPEANQMAETLTANFSWTKPDPGASANTWGATLNADLDKIDAQVFANQTAINAGQVPIGSISMFGGATPPTGWLTCDGSSLSTAAPYDKLFAVTQYAFGGSGANFNLPDLRAVFPLGVNASNPLGLQAGSYSYTLDVAHLPSHAHPITDVTHTHTINQTPHLHGDPGHTHVVNETPHTHGSNLLRSGAGAATAYAGGSPQITIGNTDPAATGISIQSVGTGILAQNANVSLNPSGTGLSTTQAVGSGSAMTIIPMYVALNFIIRYA